MPGNDETHAASQAPTSWRDVYQLVQDAEKRLTEKINDGFKLQTSVTADHEVRLRLLEATGQKTSGGVAALGVGRAVLLMLMSAGALVIAIVGFIAK